MDFKLKNELRSLLIAALEKKISEYDLSKNSGNPFVDIIFGDLSNLKSFIHSSATTMGSLYETFARKIAESNPNFVTIKKLSLLGKISSDEKAVITDIVKDLEENDIGSNYAAEIEKIYAAKNGTLKPTKITIDLYLVDKSGKEYFIEMKGPDPNKKEVRAAKSDLLNVVAIQKRSIPLKDFHKKVSIIFGVYYNNQKGNTYDNWKVSPIFERGNGLLLQEEFWDLLGGDGTYNELIQIIKEARIVLAPKIKSKIKPIINKL